MLIGWGGGWDGMGIDNVPFLYIDMITTLSYWYIEGTFVVEGWWRCGGGWRVIMCHSYILI